MTKVIQIFGERCSGTNYLAKLIQHNYPGVKVLQSEKHWKHHIDFSLRLDPDALYLIIARNVYDWSQSLHREKHEMPQMKDLTYDQFLRERGDLYHYDGQIKLHYENVFQHRNVFHHSALLLQQMMFRVEFISYDELKKDIQLLRPILSKYGIDPGLGPEKELEDYGYYKDTKQVFTEKVENLLTPEQINYINEEVNWELEAIFGFKSKLS